MRVSTIVALLALATAAPAQKVCTATNEGVPWSFPLSNAGNWFCIKLSNAAPMVVTAVECALEAQNVATADLGIWSEDPTTGKPLALLGSGTTTLPAWVPGVYGVQLAQPVVLATPGNYFVAVMLLPGVNPSIASGGTVTPHWWNPTNGWSGPHPTGAWQFRVHCGLHGGTYTTFGTGKLGSGTYVPAIAGLGFPNTTNPITIQVRDGLGGAPGVLVLGPRAHLTLPFATLYAAPAILVPISLRLGGPGGGWLNADLQLPDDPTWLGLQLAVQAILVDPGAADSISHTEGLEVTFGA